VEHLAVYTRLPCSWGIGMQSSQRSGLDVTRSQTPKPLLSYILYIKEAQGIGNSKKGKHKLYLIGVFEIPKTVSINHVEKVRA
jgi:hypothetical protein